MTVLVIALAGYQRTYVIATDDNSISVNTDKMHGGSTVGFWYRDDTGLPVLECHLDRSYTYPFCEIAIDVRQENEGIDLSAYDVVEIDIDYDGPSEARFRFYARNFNRAYSVESDPISNKFNRLDFVVSEGRSIGLEYFNVPTWWIEYYKLPLTETKVDITNVVDIELGLAADASAGLHRVTIESIVFKGHWIKIETAYQFVTILWLAIAFLYVTASLGLSRAKVKRARDKETQLENKISELKVKASTDALTGARNRSEALVKFSNYENIAKEGKMVAVALLDLDDFKQVNDQFGHEIGDQVLVRFVEMANAILPSNAQLFRWGGEEFLLIFTDIDRLECVQIIDNLNGELKSEKWGKSIQISLSAGLSILQNQSMRKAILEADKALYKAKNQGKDQTLMAVT